MEKENIVLEEINERVQKIDSYTRRIKDIRNKIPIKHTSKFKFIIIRIINTVLITVSFSLTVLFLYPNEYVVQSDKTAILFFFIGLLIVLIAGTYKMRIKKEVAIYELNKLLEDVLSDIIDDLDEKAKKNDISFNYKKDFIYYNEYENIKDDYSQSDYETDLDIQNNHFDSDGDSGGDD